jgi:dihydrofolate synthase/folylpolyglutamate synthase
MMNYDEALKFIHSINSLFCNPGLERTQELCRALGDPQDELKFIHIAGTNGKGSTSAMLDSVLREAGYKVGLFTSPYIERFNERMRVNGEPISDGLLAELCERVYPIAEGMRDKPTEFELITAIAFLYFKEMGCDIVVLECGLGGRLDATNVIKTPLLSVITGISLDHTSILGDTVEKIAGEKAGIIKSGVPVIFGGYDLSAEAVIRKEAEEKSSPFHRVDHENIHINSADLSGTEFGYGSYENIKISLLGLYQPRNAALVLSALDILKAGGLVIPEKAIYEGLMKARWSARFEIISESPRIIFDGAHNAEGIRAATNSIRHYFGEERVYVITGVLRDKEYEKIARDIVAVANKAFTITPDNPRALDGKKYAEVLASFGLSALPCPSIPEALKAARAEALSEGKSIVILGSLYTYGQVKDALRDV